MSEHPLVDAGDAMDEVAVMSAYVLAYACVGSLGYDQADPKRYVPGYQDVCIGGLVEEEKGI